MKSSVTLKPDGDKIVVKIHGVIDEEIKLANESLATAKSIDFDFSEVKGINSCGIREWIRWISPFPNTKMVYKNCPKVIVDQINMVDGFLPSNALVESFYVPYYSDELEEEKHVLFTYGKEFSEQGMNYPAEVLDSKNNPMELDVIENKYFRFLQKISKSA